MRKILYSPGYGAGWATWNDDKLFEFLTTYKPIIDFLESGGEFEHRVGDIYEHERDADGKLKMRGKMFVREDAHPLLKQLLADAEAAGLVKSDEEGVPYLCMLGAGDLKVATVSGRFRINEYDGSESITEEAAEVWH